MKDKPYISVIIPTLNEEKFLPRCLTALKNQQTTYSFEILIVDHQSRDKTTQIAKKFGAIVISESKRGTASARQRGIRHATGTIVAFTEADCVVPSNWIQTIGDYFAKNPTHVGMVGRHYFDDISPWRKNAMLSFIEFSNKLFRFLHKTYPLRGNNSAAKKDVLIQAGGFTEKKAPFDDAEAGERLAEYGPVTYHSHLVIRTSSRRIKGRLLLYAKEFFYSYIKVYILGHKGSIFWYEVIR